MGTEVIERPPPMASPTESPHTDAPPPDENKPPRPKREKPSKEKPPRKKRGTPEDAPPMDPAIVPVHTRAMRRGLLRLVTRNNAVNLALVVLVSIVAVIFLLTLFQKGLGTFTISLSRTDMYRYGIELSSDAGFASATSRLEATSITGATNIAVTDIPDNLDSIDGSHNGRNYIAYTFYVRNNGTTDLDYRYSLDINKVSRALDEAIRVAMFYNGGQREIFAKRAANGGPEPDTIPFATDTMIDGGTIMDMSIGAVDKYTIVIWIDGPDPECTDDRLGGAIDMAMSIEIINQE